MSEVYLAEQVSLGRRVALKFLRADIAERPGMSERFAREAQLLSSVEHPAVVRVIDFDPTPGQTCLVLELAEGDTLESLLEHGPMPVARGVPLLIQLAEGLAAIHDKGIVHRDFKPHNVVLTKGPRGEQARLLDFGIAKLAEPLAGANVSMPGQVVGTPAYLSPEQALGGGVDARSDVYSFGVTAFRMLSGELPLPGPSAREFLMQHVSSTPTALDVANPALAEHSELCALLMRCLQKNPANRPEDGLALLAEFSRIPAYAPNPYQSGDAFAPTLKRKVEPVTQRTMLMGVPSEPAHDDEQPHTEEVRSGDIVAPRKVTVEQLRRVGRAVVDSTTGGFRLFRRVGARAARQVTRDRPTRNAMLTVLALCLVAAVGWQLWPKSPATRAQKLIEEGQAAEAIRLIDQALLVPGSNDEPELWALKASALHRLTRHFEEADVLYQHTHQALYSGNAMVLTGLAEDFARNEDDADTRGFLSQVPPSALARVLVPLAKRRPSTPQWGALRYLDLSGAHDALNLVELYSESLESPDCPIRAAAARRLAELGDEDAIPALRALSETPKEDRSGGNCGQDEAAEAIRALKKRATLGRR